MKDKRFNYLFIIVAGSMQSLFNPECIMAQTAHPAGHDSAFYEVYPEKITTRFYFSQKYTTLTLQAPGKLSDIPYRPNTSLNMGVGATYHHLSLNLAYGFGFLNKDTEKGKTKYLDLQFHLYPGKWSLDFYGQLYKGYFLQSKGFASDSPDSYYQRPDAAVDLFGIAFYRILNHKRFSYNAAIVQNEWQKRSAGSFLYGAELYYSVLKGDSALVPRKIAAGYPQAGINRVNFFSLGPGAGYSYSMVIQQHFFITGSLTMNLNLGFTTETGLTGKNNKTDVNPSAIFRVAAGYNSSTWNLSANWVGNRLPFRGSSTSSNYIMQTGNYRIILSKKIIPGPRLKKRLAPVDRIFAVHH